MRVMAGIVGLLNCIPGAQSMARLLVMLLSATLVTTTAAHADERVASFYRGKTVTLIVGTAPGAAYDLVGRTVAQSMLKRIPGEPSLVVQNMPGAASLIMVNQLYNRAPRDGATFGLALNSILLEQRLQLYVGTGSNVQFDLAKLGWIGSPSRQPNVMWVWHTASPKTFSDLRSMPVKLGATSPSADSAVVPSMTNRLLGTKVGVITGYKGLADIFIAAERGEIEGNSTPLSSMTSGRADDVRAGKFRFLAQFGAKRAPFLNDVPTGIELARDQKARNVLELFALKFEAAYPFILPPDVPAERTSALRKAFDETMADAQFQEQAKRAGFDVDAMTGAEITALITRIAAANADTVAALADAIKPGEASKK